MASDTIDLHSPYRPEECARRLRMATDHKRLFRGRNPLIGTITDTALKLRRRLGYRNSFQIFLFATMTPEAGGTRIRCRFGMHPAAIAFLIVWFGLVAIGLGIGIVVAFDLFGVDAGVDHRRLWPAAVLPLVMALFALFWLKLSRRLAEEDEIFLVEFLRFSLDSEPIRP